MHILVIGGICHDFVSYVDRFPKPGESIRSDSFIMGNGGKGASAAVMASLMGASVKMIGQVGEDIFGDSCLKKLNESGLNTEYICKTKDAITALAVITVDSKGENCLVTHLGANLTFFPQQILKIEDQIAESTILLCQNEIPHESNLIAFRIAKKHNVTKFLNAAPYRQLSLGDELFQLTDIICTNENETELLVDEKLETIEDYKKAALKMLEYGPKFVIVTLGANGELFAEKKKSGGEKVDKIEALKVDAVDTTGAGDCFCGSFAYYYSQGFTPLESAKRAAHVASLSVTKNGNQCSYPTKKELEKHGLL